jgi:hypothetical protein
MKLKKTILILLVLLISSCKEEKNENDYIYYIPQVFDGDRLVEVPKMMTEKHKKSVVKILKYYDEDWKIENGKLLVSKKIDKQILWNYTTKANDTIWMSEHIRE